jgi:hypothetical protein
MKTSELRQKDAAGLQAEIKELQKAHFTPLCPLVHNGVKLYAMALG